MKNVARNRLKNSQRPNRLGVFTVEFALVSSIFFVVLIACFEFSRIFFTRHTLDQAAYEACRTGIIQGRNKDDVEARANMVLSAAGIKAKSISVSPPVFTELTETVSVTITCNVVENSWIPSRFFMEPEISATIILDHENQSYLVKPDVDDEVGDNDGEPVDT